MDEANALNVKGLLQDYELVIDVAVNIPAGSECGISSKSFKVTTS
jgi:hypothetical protein